MSCDYTPTPPVLTSTTQYLADAQAAYHALMTGTRVVRIKDQNGEEIQYDQLSAPRLLAYINSLNDALNPQNRISGPMRMFF